MNSMKLFAPKALYAVVGWICAVGVSHAAMHELDDGALSLTTGQSAFFTDYIPPSTTYNIAEPGINADIGFFTLGLQGTVELNANINRLQLGCGGVNGRGCDIDLSKVRLTGTTVGPSGTYADSDAKLTNPFIQLAIYKPLSLSERHVVGLNLGAQQILGQLSIGENPFTTEAGQPGGIPGRETGINTLSGSIPTTVNNLTVPVTVCVFNGPNASGTDCNTGLFGIPDTKVNGSATITGGTYSQLLFGKRLTGQQLGVIPLTATVSVLGLPVTVNVNANVNENLIDVHNLAASSTTTQGLSLSLNSQPIAWPQIGSAGTYSWNTNPNTYAQTGWWLGVPGATLDLASATPGRAYVGTGSLFATSTLPSLNLGQVPLQNCYGGLKFC